MIRSVFVALVAVATVGAQEFRLHPTRVTLDHAGDRHRVVAIATDATGITREVVPTVRFDPPDIAQLVDGHVVPLADGRTTLLASHDGREASIVIEVHDAKRTPPVSFRNDVEPVLARAGCNSGACHGAASGKNGFGLSLFGFDPQRDLRALSRDYRARRLDCADPDASLMLGKPTNEVRHKGGKRLERGDPMWTTLRDWIAEGAADDGAAAPALVGIAVEPRELVLAGPDRATRFVVTATYADGSLRDVTDYALLSSSSATTARVEGDTVVSGARGEAFVLARFGFLAEVAQVIVLPDASPWTPPESRPVASRIDELVHAKLAKLRIAPLPVCDDATFVRRVHLDVVGALPTPAEVAAFVADPAADKRSRLVDALLERPEFADTLTAQWAEVLRIEPQQLEAKGVQTYTRWLREAFRSGVPIDRIVRELLTARGSGFAVPAANYWIVATDPKVLAENAAQTFLGIRVQCAQCHNHPFERWTMDDYYGFAAFFGQVGRKRGDDPRDTIVFDQGRGDVVNERTGRASAPRPLGGTEASIAAGTDRRAALAAWLTAPDNPWFASNVANRLWARFFGRGLVDPVDDVRVSNPSSHPELHTYLAERLVAAGFDVRVLVREICGSSTYQAAQQAPDVPPNTYAGSVPRRLGAEQLLDAISAVTDVPTKFRGLPLGASAQSVADADAQNRFLDLFGRPRRESVCTCERREEPTLNQVLHLINGETVEEKLRSGAGRLGRLLDAGTAPDVILDELFLAAYARTARAEEKAHVLETIAAAGDGARAAWEDVLWAILNSKEFLFQH